MEIRKAEAADADVIYSLVQDSIKHAYGKYYNADELQFFIDWHVKEAVTNDINKGAVYVLTDGADVLATCTVDGSYITRLFVDKAHMRRGCGSFILQFIEKQLLDEYGYCLLATSIPAKEFYLKRGYGIIDKQEVEIKDGVFMQYEVMKKTKRSEI